MESIPYSAMCLVNFSSKILQIPSPEIVEAYYYDSMTINLRHSPKFSRNLHSLPLLSVNGYFFRDLRAWGGIKDDKLIVISGKQGCLRVSLYNSETLGCLSTLLLWMEIIITPCHLHNTV
jgi:hypothetical protein